MTRVRKRDVDVPPSVPRVESEHPALSGTEARGASLRLGRHGHSVASLAVLQRTLGNSQLVRGLGLGARPSSGGSTSSIARKEPTAKREVPGHRGESARDTPGVPAAHGDQAGHELKGAGELHGKALGEALEKRVNVVAAGARASRAGTLNAINDGVGTVDTVKEDLEAVADVYEKAFSSFKETLEEGEARLKQVEAFDELVLGIAVSVGVGLGIGEAMAGVAHVKLTSHALIEVGHKVADWGLEQAIAGPSKSATGEAATKVFLENSHPALRRLEAFKKVSDLYRELAILGNDVDAAAKVSDWCGEVTPDARELAVAGHHRTLKPAELSERVIHLEEAGRQQQEIANQVKEVVGHIKDAARQAKEARAGADVLRMEKQLWIHWMASLPPEDADLTDADPIEFRLEDFEIAASSRVVGGVGTLIGWDVGEWHSSADSKEGVELARGYSIALRLVGKVGSLIEVESGKRWAKVVIVVADGKPPWTYDSEVIGDGYNHHDGDEVRVVSVLGVGETPWLVVRRVKEEGDDKAPADTTAGDHRRIA